MRTLEDLNAARARLDGVVGWLKRHGIAAVSLAWPSSGDDAAQLNAIAQEQGANVIVAGAYGHSRLREWALGGVTRELLLRADRCVLVSHWPWAFPVPRGHGPRGIVEHGADPRKSDMF